MAIFDSKIKIQKELEKTRNYANILFRLVNVLYRSVKVISGNSILTVQIAGIGHQFSQ